MFTCFLCHITFDVRNFLVIEVRKELVIRKVEVCLEFLLGLEIYNNSHCDKVANHVVCLIRFTDFTNQKWDITGKENCS